MFSKWCSLLFLDNSAENCFLFDFFWVSVQLQTFFILIFTEITTFVRNITQQVISVRSQAFPAKVITEIKSSGFEPCPDSQWKIRRYAHNCKGLHQKEQRRNAHSEQWRRGYSIYDTNRIGVRFLPKLVA